VKKDKEMMGYKTITSQDGHQVFTCGARQVYDIGRIEPPPDNTFKYSVGVDGTSIGQFDTIKQASTVLEEITAFLSGDEMSYTVPANEPSVESKE